MVIVARATLDQIVLSMVLATSAPDVFEAQYGTRPEQCRQPTDYAPSHRVAQAVDETLCGIEYESLRRPTGMCWCIYTPEMTIINPSDDGGF